MAHSRDIELGDECPKPLSHLTELAKEDPARRFYSIAHFLTPRALYEAFKGLRRNASAGVDGVTFQDYQKELGRNLQNLVERVKSGQYRAQPLRRVYIPKEDGKERPISIPTVSANYTFKQYSFGMGRDLPSLSPSERSAFPGAKGAAVIGSGDVDSARSDAWDTQCAARVDRLGGTLAIEPRWPAAAAICLGGTTGVGEAGGEPPPGA